MHLVPRHDHRGGGARSALVAHRPDGSERWALDPGEAVAIRARDILHGWDRLDVDERRTMTAIGFGPARR